MEVRLLGPVEVRGPSGQATTVAGPKVRGVLAVLALEAGSTVSTERLISAVWGDAEQSRVSAVQVAVSKARRVIADLSESDRLLSQPSGYLLDVPRGGVDALRFEALLEHALQIQPEWQRVAESLESALSLWRGEPLGGAPETEILAAVRTRLRELRERALEDHVEARMGLGMHDRVIADLEHLVSEAPLREKRWVLLIRALHGAGRQADALGAYRRARELLIEQVGVEPGPELRLAHEQVLSGESDAPVVDVGSRHSVGAEFRRRGNVRHPIDVCIGRSREVDDVTALLQDYRLVTLVGPGGVGKTRLAIEVSVAQEAEHPEGVWWVDLASALTAGDALGSVQRSLGLERQETDSQKQLELLGHVLHDKSALLVLDNCEHLIGELAPLVVELLASCAEMRIVATSREALRVPGEMTLHVEPLASPDAAELFRSRLARPLDPETDTDQLINAICDQLDRLPLAVELAAARARHLTLVDLLGRLSDRFEVLSEGTREAPSRQQGLRAVAEWSYELLDQSERPVFERLSVFNDGASLDAARAVCASDAVPADLVEETLNRLVDKSLVVAELSGTTTRYRMLQTLADFAADQLAAHGELDNARRAHAEWVRDLSRTMGWRSRITGSSVAYVHAEDAAIRAAIAWASEFDGELAIQICNDLAPYWFGSMRVSTGWELFLMALAAPPPMDAATRSAALAWAAVFATMAQDIESADRYAEEAWRYEQQLGDPERLGRLCFTRALAAGFRPDGDAQRWVSQARQHLTVADVPVGLGHVHFAAGSARLVDGDLQGGAVDLAESIEVFRREQDHLGLVLGVSRLGECAWRLGDLELYAEMHSELLELGRASDSPGVVTGATARLALARLQQGEHELAERMARSALEASGGSFMPVVNGFAFRSAGLVDLARGLVEEGRKEILRAIAAFEGGAGTVGVGMAATCWLDLRDSYRESGEVDLARDADAAAAALAAASGDPWVIDQVRRGHADGS